MSIVAATGLSHIALGVALLFDPDHNIVELVQRPGACASIVPILRARWDRPLL